MLVIGLISGTSVDGIDTALVDISGSVDDLEVVFIAGETYPYPSALRERILAVAEGEALSVAELAELDDTIAHYFAQAALSLQSEHPSAELIGSHGQTVYHRPPRTTEIPLSSQLGYSLQLGRGAAIADLTGITTVSNFRVADIAVGGQGAPLVSTVDVALLSHCTYNRCVQNIGGIGNVTFLPAKGELVSLGASKSKEQAASQSYKNAPYQPNQPEELTQRVGSPRSIVGWDTGPGNMLLDLAVQQLSGGTKHYDEDGAWAATGSPCQELVNQWLQQDFFQLPPPKSTGREHFGHRYLAQCLADIEAWSLSEADILATLTEFTAASIEHSYRNFLFQMPDQVLLCGGGSKNIYLKHRLQTRLKSVPLLTTDEVGLNAEFKEAIAFAVLAYWRHQGIPGNLPEVTGARRSVLLGEIQQAG